MIKQKILDILKDDYTTDIGEINKCKYLEISKYAEKIARGLKREGFHFGIHPDFRSCSKCNSFHEAPHHENCQTCKGFSNFTASEDVCSKCGKPLK